MKKMTLGARESRIPLELDISFSISGAGRFRKTAVALLARSDGHRLPVFSQPSCVVPQPGMLFKSLLTELIGPVPFLMVGKMWGPTIGFRRGPTVAGTIRQLDTTSDLEETLSCIRRCLRTAARLVPGPCTCIGARYRSSLS